MIMAPTIARRLNPIARIVANSRLRDETAVNIVFIVASTAAATMNSVTMKTRMTMPRRPLT